GMTSTGIGSTATGAAAAGTAGATPLRSDLHCSQNSAPSSLLKWQKGQIIMVSCSPFNPLTRGAGDGIKRASAGTRSGQQTGPLQGCSPGHATIVTRRAAGE